MKRMGFLRTVEKSTCVFRLVSLIVVFTGSTIMSYGQVFNSLDLHSSVNRVQPMTGIVFWADNSGDLTDLGNKTQLEFSYLVYSDVINEEGVYDWSDVDNLLTTAANRGRQVILRFRYTYPGVTKRSVPQYISDRDDYTEQFQQVEGSNTYIPDWSNGALEDFTLEFYTAFADRYDNDSRLAFIQLGFGSYSEYHLYDGPSNPLGTYFPTKTFQAEFLNHVNAEFVNTQWSISIDAASGSYTPLSSSNTLKDLNFGLFDDSFLHSEHSKNESEYNRSSWLEFGVERADDHVAGGELNYYSDWDQEHVLDETGPYDFTYEELSEMYDITYMIGNDQLNYQTADRIEEAGMSNGYHYEVTEFSTDGSNTKVTIKNNGIAPIYYDTYPTVNGVSSTASLKGMIRGESKTFTIATVATGEDLVLSCSRTVTGQEIQFDASIDKNVVSIKPGSEIFTNSIYPNPVSDVLNINNKNGNSFNVSICSLTGEVISSYTVTGELKQINVKDLQKGTYLLKFETSELWSSTLFVKK